MVHVEPVPDQPPKEAPGSIRSLVVKETDVVYITRHQLHFVDEESLDSELTYTITSPPSYRGPHKSEFQSTRHTHNLQGLDKHPPFLSPTAAAPTLDGCSWLTASPNSRRMRVFTQVSNQECQLVRRVFTQVRNHNRQPVLSVFIQVREDRSQQSCSGLRDRNLVFLRLLTAFPWRRLWTVLAEHSLALCPQHAVDFLKVAYMPPLEDTGPQPQQVGLILSVFNRLGRTVTGICFNITVLPVDNQPPQVQQSPGVRRPVGEKSVSDIATCCSRCWPGRWRWTRGRGCAQPPEPAALGCGLRGGSPAGAGPGLSAPRRPEDGPHTPWTGTLLHCEGPGEPPDQGHSSSPLGTGHLKTVALP